MSRAPILGPPAHELARFGGAFLADLVRPPKMGLQNALTNAPEGSKWVPQKAGKILDQTSEFFLMVGSEFLADVSCAHFESVEL